MTLRCAAPTDIDVTVLICTRNRAARLSQALASAAGMRIPAGLRWELIVVDNGSSDDTAKVALGFSDRLPIRVVRESAAGLSHARNCGVSEAKGRYICWTDDDVVIDPDWLVAYVTAFARHPEAAVFGGHINPLLEAPTPAWFARLADNWPLSTLLAKRDFGDAPIRLSLEGGIVPWGANFAVRTAEQRSVRFEAELGVSPHQQRVGEEAEAIYRIFEAGGRGWWVPEASVRHIIPVQRQTLRYVFDYFRASGETVAYMERTWPGAHHQSANQRDLAWVRRGLLPLYGAALLNAVLFSGCWGARLQRRGLQFLTRTAFYVGVASFRASSPREHKNAPSSERQANAAASGGRDPNGHSRGDGIAVRARKA